MEHVWIVLTDSIVAVRRDTKEVAVKTVSIYSTYRIARLKAQYWPLCFARLCCCFGFHGSEASIVYEFYSGSKRPLNFQHHKMVAKRLQVQCLMGNTGSLK